VAELDSELTMAPQAPQPEEGETAAGEQQQQQQQQQQEEERERPEFSMMRLVGINLPALNYGLVGASVGVLVLPQEAERMFGQQRSLYLALMLALTGFSQLVCPLIGYASDRTRSSMGRRMPYILFGDAAALVSLGMLYIARTELWGNAYLASILATILALNVAYTGFTGLVSDVVPPSQLGVASGVMGALTALGAVGGLLGVGFFLELRLAYPLYGGTILVSMPLVWLAAHAHDGELPAEKCQPWALSDLRSSYWISPSTHGDFFWVFVSRTFYYMAVSVQIYILYYLRDMVVEEWVAENSVRYTTVLCVIAQGSTALVATQAGGLSDQFGRKPLIYLACAVMAGVYVGYTFITSYYAVMALGLIYGASNGVYLAVDYALAVECLPDSGKDSAKDLALWGIAAFLGACFGPAITGPLLTAVGAETQAQAQAAMGNRSSLGNSSTGGDRPNGIIQLQEPAVETEATAMLSAELSQGDDNVHYRREGYVAVMTVGMLYSLACGLAVMRVQRGNAKATGSSTAPDAARSSSCCWWWWCCCSSSSSPAHKHERLPESPSDEQEVSIEVATLP
jgi:MFS family permease